MCFSFSLIKTAHDALPVLAYACAILCSRQTLTHGSQSCLAAVSRVKEEEKRTKKNRIWWRRAWPLFYCSCLICITTPPFSPFFFGTFLDRSRTEVCFSDTFYLFISSFSVFTCIASITLSSGFFFFFFFFFTYSEFVSPPCLITSRLSFSLSPSVCVWKLHWELVESHLTLFFF